MVKGEKARYNLTVPQAWDAELLSIAERHRLSVLDLIRRFCLLGVSESIHGPFFYFEDGVQREIEVFPPKGEHKLRLWMHGGYDTVPSIREER